MRMTLLAELEDFVRDHRPHGGMTDDATEPAWNGYRLTGPAPAVWSSNGGSRPRTPRWTSSAWRG